jgi:hypothetical protein
MSQKSRCANKTCEKKLKTITFTCECQLVFCINCRNAIDHNCTFDRISVERKKLERENPHIEADKIAFRIV